MVYEMAPNNVMQMAKPYHVTTSSLGSGSAQGTPASSPDQGNLQLAMIKNSVTADDLGSCGSARTDEDLSDDDAAAGHDATRYLDNRSPMLKEEAVDQEEAEDQSLQHRSSPGLSKRFCDLSTSDDRSYSTKMRTARGEAPTKPYNHLTRNDLPKHEPSLSVTKTAPAPPSPLAAPKHGVDYYRKVHENLKMFISEVVCVEKYDSVECYNDAKKLAKVTMMMTESGQLHKFAEVFGHSVSCIDENCTNTCRMFRRIRGHVSNASHRCAVMHVYSQLLRMHIDSCNQLDCGLGACKAMLATRLAGKLYVLPRNFKKVEEEIQQKIKEKLKQDVGTDCTNKDGEVAVVKTDGGEDTTIKPKQENVLLIIAKKEMKEVVPATGTTFNQTYGMNGVLDLSKTAEVRHVQSANVPLKACG